MVPIRHGNRFLYPGQTEHRYIPTGCSPLSREGTHPYHQHPYEHMNFIIEGQGVLVNEAGEEQPLKAGDFALVLPGEKHQYRNTSPDRDFKMICGVPKEFE